MEKIIIHGEEFIYDGRGYVPAPPAPFQETDPKFEAEKSIFAKKTDIPEIPDLTPYAKKDDIPVVDNFGLKAQYADIYYRKDAVYENDYIRLKSIGTNKIYEVKKLTVRTSFGDKVVDSKVVFNNGFCYLFSEYLSKSANWELFILEYDIVNNIRTYPPDLRGKIGRNILINEPQDGYHGAMMTGVFNSLYSQLGGSTRQVVHTPSTIFTENLDEKAVELKFNAATYAYWYGANTMEVSSAPDILVVSSHTGNTDERKDITPDANTFKNNVIAVSAGEKTDGSGVWTSYGFGVEFFEAYDKAEMNLRYPAKNHYTAIFGMYTSDARTIITGTETNPTTGVVKRHTVGAQRVVGETLYLHHGSNIIEFKVAELIDEHTLKSDRDLPVIPSADGSTKAYVWNYTTIGDIFRSAPQQSATCAMVLAKFALIQDRTDANWQLVREAARMTASNSTMQVVSGKKVYTTNWDMKRGFGIIDVEKAIEYIEENYSNNPDYIDSVIPQLPKMNPLLKMRDLDSENYVSKAMLQKVFDYFDAIVGGRNLVLDSLKEIVSSGYFIGTVELSEDIEDGELVRITVWGDLGEGQKLYVGLHPSSGVPDKRNYIFTKGLDGTYSGEFIFSKSSIHPNDVRNRLDLYNYPYPGGVSLIKAVKIEKICKRHSLSPIDLGISIENSPFRIKEASGKIMPVLLNNFQSENLYYEKVGFNVKIKGMVSNPSLSTPSTIFVLPEGFRPKMLSVFTGSRIDVNDLVIYVYTNGDVVYFSGGSGNVNWAAIDIEFSTI